MAHKALQAEEEIGLLLPCNVVVYDKEDKTVISFFDPMTMSTLSDNPALKEIAENVKNKLERVFEAV